MRWDARAGSWRSCCGGAGLFLLCGLHRIYVGRFWTGLLWFFTLGLCGIGQLIDLFRLGGMVRVANREGGGTRQSASANTVAPVFNVTINAAPAGIMPAGTMPAAPEQIAGPTTRLLSGR